MLTTEFKTSVTVEEHLKTKGVTLSSNKLAAIDIACMTTYKILTGHYPTLVIQPDKQGGYLESHAYPVLFIPTIDRIVEAAQLYSMSS